jgi:tetratricopeptide (TPR) repeat protein
VLLVLWCLGGVVAAGCAARTLPPVVTTAKYPDFMFPSAPADTSPELMARLKDGWQYLQADDVRSAEREFQAALKQRPKWAPAEAALGYAAMARRRSEDALEPFNRALAAEPSYVPALVGRGHVLEDLKRPAEAMASFEAALAADPRLTDLPPRIEMLRFRAAGDTLSRARAAADGGRLDEARRLYEQAIADSPESAFLYRDLAVVEGKAGQSARALEHLRRAVQLDPSDARAHAALGALLDEQGDTVAALEAFERARALDRDAVPDRTLARARDLAALAKLPPQYRHIPQVPEVTRAELAALIGVRLESLVSRLAPRQVIITDSRGHWAQPWITPVVRSGIMEVLPNYAFDPDAVVRRGDLARVVDRVLGFIAAERPEAGRAWQSARVRITDVAPEHLLYPAASAAVASGVMALDNGAFDLLRPVTGASALDAMAKLEALASP